MFQINQMGKVNSKIKKTACNIHPLTLSSHSYLATNVLLLFNSVRLDDAIVSELLNRYGVTLHRGTIYTICGRLPCSCFRFL